VEDNETKEQPWSPYSWAKACIECDGSSTICNQIALVKTHIRLQMYSRTVE